MHGLRFSSLSIAAFRGIIDPIVFDLSAPLTVVFAPNGTGKTTMCDAAEWLLTGQVERLKDGKDFDANVLRSKFAKEDNSPSVAAELIVEGKPRFLARAAEGSHSSAEFGHALDNMVRYGPHDLLSLLAPAAAAHEAHHLTAINLRQRWLKGTRFLSAEALAALVDTDDAAIERRAQVFADLLGIRHLLDAERQCERYISEFSSRLRTVTQVIEQQSSEANALEEALAAADQAPPEGIISARSEVVAAERLLEPDAQFGDDEQGAIDGRLESLTAIHRRQRHALEERSRAAQRVEGQWSARRSLGQAVSEGTTLEASLAASLAEIEEQGSAAAALVVQRTTEREVADEGARALAAGKDRLTPLGAALLATLHDADFLAAEPQSLAALSDNLIEARWTAAARNQRRDELVVLQSSLEQSAGEEERLRLLDEDLAKRSAARVTDEALAVLRTDAFEADNRARTAQSLFDTTAEPVSRLQSAARDLLTHERGLDASKCPVCAYDWGDAERLRAAIEDALAATPEIAEVARESARVASEASLTARSKLDAAVSARTEGAALEKERAGLTAATEQRRREIERLGLATDRPLEAIVDASMRLDVAEALAALLAVHDALTPSLAGGSASFVAPETPVSGLLDQLDSAFASREQVIQLRLVDLAKAIESATELRDQHRANHAATQQKLHECREALSDKATELASLRAIWDSAAPGTEWSDKALATLKKELADSSQRLARAEAHIEAARAAWASQVRRVRLDELRRTIQPSLERQKHMADRLAAANRARAVFHDAYATTSRTQVQDLSRVVNPLFARMHANRVFDRINLGEDADFLHWLADAGNEQLDPGRDFSQGQRQDLALAIFLARARNLGGTFFLDEPVIHLDDLNRVGLLDILRATVLEGTQSLNLVITTSSRSLARHLIEKFAGIGLVETPSGATHALKVIELDGNGRSGVQLSTSYPLH